MKGAHIFVPLARRPFERFEAGTKGVEIRNKHSPVARQVLKAPIYAPVTLSFGYGKARRLYGFLGDVWEAGQGIDHLAPDVLRKADLRELGEATGSFDPDGPIVAFEVLRIHKEAQLARK